MADSPKPTRKLMVEILLALLVGVAVGLIFRACKLPLPAPPVLAGVVGIIGIYLGGVIANKIFPWVP